MIRLETKTKGDKMNAYEEKQARKLERFEELAHKNKDLSNSSYERSRKMGDMIPFGQPILVGHHSERGHRRHIEKINNEMRKSVDAGNKAEYYKNKADNIQNSNVISSDNPEAVNLLKEKLERLENKRKQIKEANKKARAEKKEQMPAYILANLAGNIRTVKQRIIHLENIKELPEINEEINGVKIKTNKEENRLQLFFNGKPSEEKRIELKHNGFRWSPYNSCWQRQISNRAIYIAKNLTKQEG